MSHSVIDEKELKGLNRYGPTSARPTPDKPLRYGGLTIDTHAHILVPDAAAFMDKYVDRHNVPMFRFASDETRKVSQKQAVDRKLALVDPEDRVKVLDDQGVRMQVISPTPFHCYYEAERQVSLEGTRMANEGIARFVGTHPDRFIGFGTVPLQEPDAAVAELEYCIGELGFKGALILTNVNGEEISAPRFEPFYAAAERLGAVLFLHPNGFSSERLSKHFLNNTIGNPLETTIALHYLILEGVLERYPKLKILAAHGGGFLPAYPGRIDHTWGSRQDARVGLPRLPSEYLGKIFIDSCVFTIHQLEYLVRTYGADQIVLGTDYPYDMAEVDPVGHLLSVPSFTEAEVKAVAGGTAARMLGL